MGPLRFDWTTGSNRKIPLHSQFIGILLAISRNLFKGSFHRYVVRLSNSKKNFTSSVTRNQSFPKSLNERPLFPSVNSLRQKKDNPKKKKFETPKNRSLILYHHIVWKVSLSQSQSILRALPFEIIDLLLQIPDISL